MKENRSMEEQVGLEVLDAESEKLINRAILKIQKAKMGTRIILVLVAALLLAVGLLSLTRGRQNELEEQQKQTQEQLEFQQQVIDGLRKQQEETESLLKNSVPVITSEQLQSELNAIKELVTQQYIYTNADRFERNQKWIFDWDVPFSSKSLLVTYDGTIKAGVDLAEVQVTVDEEHHAITIVLPPSKIMENNIPQETIEILEVKNGLFNEVTFDDYNNLISDQKIIMENKAIEPGLLEDADAQAKAVVEDFLSKIPGIGDPYTLTVEQTKR